MATRYFAARMSDGAVILRSSASRAYTHAVALKRPGETHWRHSWAGRAELAEKQAAGLPLRPPSRALSPSRHDTARPVVDQRLATRPVGRHYAA